MSAVRYIILLLSIAIVAIGVASWKHGSRALTTNFDSAPYFDDLMEVERKALIHRSRVLSNNNSNVTEDTIVLLKDLALSALFDLPSKAFDEADQNAKPEPAFTKKVDIDSSQCIQIGDSYVRKYLKTAAAKREIREQIAFEIARSATSKCSCSETKTMFSLLRSMATDERLILPPIPSLLLSATFHLLKNDQEEMAKFYASSSPKVYSIFGEQDLSMIRYTTEPIPSNTATPVLSEVVIATEDLNNNDKRDVVFEYEMTWMDKHCNCGVEFETSNGFRLRDHGPLDAHGYSPHSEKNQNMSAVAHNKWYRRLWRLNELQFETQERGGRQFRHSAASTHFLNTFVLSASSNTSGTVKALFKFVRLTELSNSTFNPPNNTYQLVKAIARSSHRYVFDPISAFANQALLLGAVVANSSLITGKSTLLRYARLAQSNSPSSGDSFEGTEDDFVNEFILKDKKTSLDRNLSQIISDTLEKKIQLDKNSALLQRKEPFPTFRSGRNLEKQLQESGFTSACNLISGTFDVAEKTLSAIDCPTQKHDDVFKIPAFTTAFHGSMQLSCVRETSIIFHDVNATRDSLTRMITMGSPLDSNRDMPETINFDFLTKKARDHHLFRDVNGVGHPLPFLLVEDEPMLRRWLTLLTSSRYRWMLEMIMHEIAAVTGKIGSAYSLRLRDPFRIAASLQTSSELFSQAFLKNHTLNTTNPVDDSHFGFPNKVDIQWRHQQYKTLTLGDRSSDDLWSRGNGKERLPVGRYIISLSKIVERFLDLYKKDTATANFHSKEGNFFLQTAALFLFDMDMGFVEKCINDAGKECKVSIVFKGSKSNGQRLVHSIQFHTSNDDIGEFMRVPIFPLAIDVPNKMPGIPEKAKAFANVFDEAEAIFYPEAVIDGERVEEVFEN